MSPGETRPVEYTYGRTKFIGRLALDEEAGGRRPGVVIFPEAFGLNEHARGLGCAARTAASGRAARRSDRLLLRRHDGAGTDAFRCSARGSRDLPFRAPPGTARRRRARSCPAARVPWRRGSAGEEGSCRPLMAELRRDKVDWQFIHYGNAAHSFTDPEAD